MFQSVVSEFLRVQLGCLVLKTLRPSDFEHIPKLTKDPTAEQVDEVEKLLEKTEKDEEV